MVFRNCHLFSDCVASHPIDWNAKHVTFTLIFVFSFVLCIVGDFVIEAFSCRASGFRFVTIPISQNYMHIAQSTIQVSDLKISPHQCQIHNLLSDGVNHHTYTFIALKHFFFKFRFYKINFCRTLLFKLNAKK